jgi:hypothetical protein
MTLPPIHRVTVAQLRALFNSHVLPRINAGELIEIVRSEGTPSPQAKQPAGLLPS